MERAGIHSRRAGPAMTFFTDPVVLTAISVIVAAAYIAVLAILGGRIADSLEAIGNREPSTSNRGGKQRSLLAKIWFGVRAIETQVSALPPQATQLNGQLEDLAGGLVAIRDSATGILGAAQRQGGSRGA